MPGISYAKAAKEYLKIVLTAAIMYSVISVSLVKAYHIESGSMEYTLMEGDKVLVNKFLYGVRVPLVHWRLPALRDPSPGDIVVFEYPFNSSIQYVKRCIAVPGQTIEIKNKSVYVNGHLVASPPTMRKSDMLLPPGYQERGISPTGNGNRDNYGPITVTDKFFFVLGDNRDNSEDSRYWGFVPRENILGKAEFIYWSWDPAVPYSEIWNRVRWSRLFSVLR